MNDSMIHDGLPEADIRDGICDGLLATYLNKPEEVENRYPHNGTITDNVLWDIRDKEAKMVLLRFQIDKSKKRLALITLMEMKGWQEFDVSDDILRSGDKLCRNFIGTEDELATLLKKIEK